jgi:hypothetical protein
MRATLVPAVWGAAGDGERLTLVQIVVAVPKVYEP